MPYITKIHVHNHYRVGDLVLDLSGPPGPDAPFRHLILTGPNAAGKSTILLRISEEIRENWRGNSTRAGLKSNTTPIGKSPDQVALAQEKLATLFHVALDWSGPISNLAPELNTGRLISAYLPAQRKFVPNSVTGPNRLSYGHVAPHQLIASQLKQYLVNQNVQARLARYDDPAASYAIFDWLESFEQSLADLYGLPGLKMDFDRQKFDIQFREPDGTHYAFDQLADGHSSVLQILGELILRTSASKEPVPDTTKPEGVVLIDELDTHLHPSLQERILPFLAGLFPRVQFLVATHSPAIISSAANAVVFDLGTKDRVLSEHLRGTPYGRLMTTHFGLETDFDIASTDHLRRLDELSQKPNPTEAEREELRTLAESLRQTSHSLALEVWNRLEVERIERGDS